MTASTSPSLSSAAARGRSARARVRAGVVTPPDLVVRHVAAPKPPVRHLVPTLLLAGVSHADASGLTAALDRHPDVCVASTRRIDHFTPLRYGLEAPAPLADYDRHFARWAGERHRLETSPVYFDGGPALVEAVAAAMPAADVVVLLRDPAERLWASYLDKVARGRLPEAMPYETFVDRCLALRAAGSDRFEGNRYFRTLSSGFYAEHLPAWLEVFGDRCHVVFAEHLTAAPAAELAALLARLDLDPALLAPAEPPVQPPAAPAKLPFATRMSRFWPLAQRSSGGQAVDEVAQRLGIPPQGDRQRNRVRGVYARANRDLAALLRARGCTRLPDWLLDA
jgi:hypothetical protein